MAAGCTVLQIGRCVVAGSVFTTIATFTAVTFAAIAVTRSFFAVAVASTRRAITIRLLLLLRVLIRVALRHVVSCCIGCGCLCHGRCGLVLGFLGACI